MSAIMVGVGGMGGAIVADVRRQLERRTNAEGSSPAARQRALQYRFFLVDTKEEPFSRDFQPNERFVIPSGLDKFYVDEKTSNWYASDGRGDDFFEQWWPTHNGVPYRVGDFDEGAGQIRIKGKLAYRIHVAQGRATIVDAVDEAVRSIRNARGLSSNRDLQKIPVYIISSLGGGTGSGIVLTLAKHLRRTLPSYCVLQGVFLLASIAALAPGKADEASIWANTDAALREIDYYQRPQAFRLDQPTPYLEWPGAGNRIPNQDQPFQYIYLFTRGNREALTLESLDAYTRLVAECLVAENFGEIGELIKGPHSQYVARFIETPDVEDRATSYASVGLAGVRYPADRIVQHLSRTFGARVIARAFGDASLLATETDGKGAKTFLQEQKDLWDEAPTIRQDYRSPISPDEPMPRLKKLDDAPFLDATKSRIEAVVNDRLREFDDWRSRNLASFLSKKTAQREAQMLKGDERGLRSFVAKQLDGGPEGVARAVASVAAVLVVVKGQLLLVQTAIEDPEKLTPDGRGVGLIQQAKNQRLRVEVGIKGLQDASGGIRGRDKSKEAKEQYVGYWNQYVQSAIELDVANAAVGYYEALRREVEATQEYLNELILAARSQGAQLERSAIDDLGANIKDSVLNVGILDDVTIVDHHFKGLMDRSVDEAGGGLIKDLVSGTGGLSEALRTKVDRRAAIRHELVLDDFRESIVKAVLDAGTRLFEAEVGKLTIWDAIKYECIARKELDEPDDDFDTAMTALNQNRAELSRGGTPLVKSDTYLLQHYIQAKLARLRNQAAPYWQLDQSELSNYSDIPGLLYPITVLALDRTCYDDFAAREGLSADLVHSIAQSVGVEPQHLPGPDAIMLYRREGVAPLFFLSKEERSVLRASAARISGRNKEIYTDIRLRDKLDPIIAPPERPNDRRKYALGLLVHAVTAATSGSNGAQRLGWTRFSGDTLGHASIKEAMQALRDDPALEQELFALANAKVDGHTRDARHDAEDGRAADDDGRERRDGRTGDDYRSQRDRSDVLVEAIENLKDFRSTRDETEARWWQQTINTIERRLNTAQYRV